MQSFSTDSLPAEDRFDHWREERGKSLFGVTIELPREKRSAFHGEFRARQLGAAVASEMSASSYVVGRTPGDIARQAGDSLCLGLQVRGGGALEAGGDVASVGEGGMSVSYSDLPYLATPASDGGFLCRVLKIPYDAAIMLDLPIDDLFSAQPAEDAMVTRALRAVFGVLTTLDGESADPEQDVAHVARLALVARGRLSLKQPEARTALHAGLRYAALEIMRRDLRKADLGPATVAQELGVSVRQLHVLFEHSEQSFSRTLTRVRVEAAGTLLRRARALSVTQVALACGFDSLATFYRAFGRAHGLSPNAFRMA